MGNKKLYVLVMFLGVVLLGIAFYLGVIAKVQTQGMGLIIGLGLGLLGSSIGLLLEGKMIKKRPELYKRKMIEMEDERNILVKNKAEAAAGKILLWLNYGIFIPVIFLNVDSWVSFALITVNLIYSLSYIYFFNKFHKE